MHDETKLDFEKNEVESLKSLVSCLKVRIMEIKNDRNYGLGLSQVQSLETFMDMVKHFLLLIFFLYFPFLAEVSSADILYSNTHTLDLLDLLVLFFFAASRQHDTLPPRHLFLLERLAEPFGAEEFQRQAFSP